MNIYAFRGRLPYAQPHWDSNTQEVNDDHFLHGSTIWVFKDSLSESEINDGYGPFDGIPLEYVRRADYVVVVDRTSRTETVIKDRYSYPPAVKHSSRLAIMLQELWCKLRARELSTKTDVYPYNPSHALAYATALYHELAAQAGRKTTS